MALICCELHAREGTGQQFVRDSRAPRIQWPFYTVNITFRKRQSLTPCLIISKLTTFKSSTNNKNVLRYHAKTGRVDDDKQFCTKR
eukprot:9468173-Pyramimonas_sp.AAC.1